MRLADIIVQSIEKLKTSSIDNPQLDARLLICHALKCDRAALLSQSHRVLNDDEVASIDILITQRMKHISVARITGSREFWGLNFGLNEATLEPRADSETIVEAVLSFSQKNARILDLGTGTGCLLLSLLHEIPEATGIGIDISSRAVEQAAQNAVLLGLSHRAVFRSGDWFEEMTETFDIIISNPPYIPSSDILALMPEVRHYDPMLALDGGKDGFTPYRFLIPQLKKFLNPNGVAAFEVGIDQAQHVADLFRQSGFTNIETRKDLGGVERCVTATMSKILA